MSLELLETICHQWELGELICEPRPLTGGFMHKMYSLFTSKGKYAVKLLNPYVMQRETAQGNYRTAEKLELVLEQHNIPILPALTFTGRKMQELDGQFFYLYDWYDGRALKEEEITVAHCAIIGKLLADIHGIEKRDEPCGREEMQIDWDFYIEKPAQHNEELYRLVSERRNLLFESQLRGNLAMKKLSAVSAICHNDMDSKNVLWNGMDCRIIDLECLTYSNPALELYEMALCWAGYESGTIKYDLFGKLIQSYLEAGGVAPEDWEVLYDSNIGRLEWLEYNIKRALGIECADEEIPLGVSEVRNTIAQIVLYHEAKESILRCVKTKK